MKEVRFCAECAATSLFFLGSSSTSGPVSVPEKKGTAPTGTFLHNLVETTVAGAAGVALGTYVGMTSPYDAYVTVDLAKKRVGFLGCLREHTDDKYELETFELASGTLQAQYMRPAKDLTFSMPGPYKTVARKTFRYHPVKLQEMLAYVKNMPLLTYGSKLDTANNFLNGRVTKRFVYWVPFLKDQRNQIIKSDLKIQEKEGEENDTVSLDKENWSSLSIERIIGMMFIVKKMGANAPEVAA